MFQWGGGGGFSDGGFIFKWLVHPMGGIGFDVGVFKKNCSMEGGGQGKS